MLQTNKGVRLRLSVIMTYLLRCTNSHLVVYNLFACSVIWIKNLVNFFYISFIINKLLSLLCAYFIVSQLSSPRRLLFLFDNRYTITKPHLLSPLLYVQKRKVTQLICILLDKSRSIQNYSVEVISLNHLYQCMCYCLVIFLDIGATISRLYRKNV